MIAGTTKSAATSSAPTTVSAAVVARATRPIRIASKTRGSGPSGAVRVGSKPVRSQCRPIRALAASVATADAGRKRDVAAVDQQQAAEQQRLDVRARAEDVAGEDHAGRERAGEDERHDRVLPRAPPAERRDADGEEDRGSEGPQRRREAEPVGQDQSRKGGGADGVREEGEAAQHDPGAEQTGGDRQDQDLDQAALDEGKLEGLEHAGIKSK